MDEEFDFKQLSKDADAYFKSINADSDHVHYTTGRTAKTKPLSEVIKEQNEKKTKLKQSLADKAHVTGTNAGEEPPQWWGENVGRWVAGTLGDIGAAIWDNIGSMDAGDWHHSWLNYEGVRHLFDPMGISSDSNINPITGKMEYDDNMTKSIGKPIIENLGGISKYIDNTLGDGEQEIGNWFIDRAAHVREMNQMYNQVNTGNETFDYIANGTSSLVGSIVGNMLAPAAMRGMSSMQMGNKLMNMTGAAFLTTNSVGMMIANDVYNQTFDAVLETNQEYKDQYKAIYDDAKTQYLSSASDSTTKYGDAEMYAKKEAEKFKEEFVQQNPELVNQAKQAGIKGADTAIKTNAASFLFNLTTSALAMKGLGETTRSFEKETWKQWGKEMAQEIGGEIIEEAVIENVAEKRGLAAGLGKDYGWSDAANDVFSKEGLESAVWAAIGGGGTKGAIDFLTRKSRKAQQEQGLAAIKMQNELLAKSGSPSIENVLSFKNSVQEITNIERQRQQLLAKAEKTEDTKEAESLKQQAKDLGNKIVFNQALTAFKTGTTENLLKVYEGVLNHKDASPEAKKKATELISDIKAMEKIYHDAHTGNYENTSSVFLNRANDYMVNKALQEVNTSVAAKESEALLAVASAKKTGELPTIKRTYTERTPEGQMDIIKGEELGESLDHIFGVDEVDDVSVKEFEAAKKQLDIVKGMLGKMSDEEYNNFIDKGEVTEDRITNTAYKIAQNLPLTTQEKQLMSDKDTVRAINEKVATLSNIEEEKSILETKVAEYDKSIGDSADRQSFATQAKEKVQAVRELDTLKTRQADLEAKLAKNSEEYNKFTSKEHQKALKHERDLMTQLQWDFGFKPLMKLAKKFKLPFLSHDTMKNTMSYSMENDTDKQFLSGLDTVLNKYKGKIPDARLADIREALLKEKRLKNTLAKIAKKKAINDTAQKMQQEKRARVDNKTEEVKSREEQTKENREKKNPLHSENNQQTQDSTIQDANVADIFGNVINTNVDPEKESALDNAAKDTKEILNNASDIVGNTNEQPKTQEDKNDEAPNKQSDVDAINDIFGNITSSEENTGFFDPEEIQSNLTPDQEKAVSATVANFKSLLEDKLGREASFEEVLKEFINRTSKADADKLFNALVKGWELNGFPPSKYDAVYNRVFKSIEQAAMDMVDAMSNILAAPVETPQQQQQVFEELNEQPLLEDTKHHPATRFTIDNEPVVDKQVNHAGRVTGNGKPKFNYSARQSITYYDEESNTYITEYDDNHLNESQDLPGLHKLFHPDYALVGDSFNISLADNYENIFIVFYDSKGIKTHTQKFGDWVRENNIVPGSQAWLDKVPMTIKDPNTSEAIAFVHDVDWYNKAKFREVEGGESREDGINNTRNIRANVYENFQQGNSTEIEVTEKSQGTYDFMIIPVDQPKIPLAEANPQTQVAFWDLKQGMMLGKKTKFEGIIENQASLPLTFTDAQGRTKNQYSYEIRRTGTQVINGKKVPTYTAFAVTQNPITEQDIESIVHAMLIHMYTGAGGNNLQAYFDSTTLQNIGHAYNTILNNTGFDLKVMKNNVEGYLQQFITPLNKPVKIDHITALKPEELPAGKTKNDLIAEEIAKVATRYLGKGKPYVTTKGGVLYFGISGETLYIKHGDKEAVVPALYLDKNQLKKNYMSDEDRRADFERIKAIADVLGKEVLPKMTQNIGWDSLDSNHKVVQVDSNYNASISSNSYQDHLKGSLTTNLKSENIGTQDDPFYVSRIQPIINYKLKSPVVETQPVVKKEINSRNVADANSEVVQEVERDYQAREEAKAERVQQKQQAIKQVEQRAEAKIEEIQSQQENTLEAQQEIQKVNEEAEKEIEDIIVKTSEALSEEEKTNNERIKSKIATLESELDSLEESLLDTDSQMAAAMLQAKIDNVKKEIKKEQQGFVTAEIREIKLTPEKLNEVKDQALSDTNWISDDGFMLDPETLTEEDVKDMMKGMLKIPGLASHHQFELVDFVFNELSLILNFEDVVKFNKSDIYNMIDTKIDEILSNVLSKYEDRRGILSAVVDIDKDASALVGKYDKAIAYINNILKNKEVIIEEGLNKIYKYTGIVETKEEQDYEDNAELVKDFSKSFFELGGKDTSSYRIKRFLAGIQDIDSQGNPITGFLGVPKYMGFDVLNDTLQALLTGCPPDLNLMLQKLESHAESMPFLKPVIEKIKNADNQLKNEFVSQMARNTMHMEFLMYTYNNRTGDYELKIYNTNANTLVRTIENKWYNGLKRSLLIPINGEYHINTEKAEKLLEEFKDFTKTPTQVSSTMQKAIRTILQKGGQLTQGTKAISDKIKKEGFVSINMNNKPYTVSIKDGKLVAKQQSKSPIQQLREGQYNKEGLNILQNWLKEFGITLSDNTMEDLFRNGLQDPHNKSAVLKFKDMFGQGIDNIAIFGNLADFLEDYTGIESKDAEFDKKVNNPLSQGIFKNLAKLEAKHNVTDTPSSFRDGQKTVQGYTISKFISDRANMLKSERPIGQTTRDNLGATSYSQHSMWLQMLQDPVFRSQFEVTHLGITALKEINKKAFGETSITKLAGADHELTKVGMFQDMFQGNTPDYDGFKTRKGTMFSPTMSDKSTMTLVKTAVLDLDQSNFNFEKDVDGTHTHIKANETLLGVLYEQLIKPDLERINKFNALGGETDIKGYDKGANLFFTLPQANTLTLTFEDKKGQKFTGTIAEAMQSNPEVYTVNVIRDMLRKEIDEMLQNYLDVLVADKLEVWKEIGFIETAEGADYITGYRFFDKTYMAKFKEVEDMGTKVHLAAFDFIINNLIANANSYMLFSGDPALYFKKNRSTSDTDYVQVVQDVFANITKRLANQMAPGIKLADSENEQYIQIFLQDTESVSTNLEFLVHTLDGKDFDHKGWEKIQKMKHDSEDEIKAKKKAIKEFASQYPNAKEYFSIEGTDAQEYTTWKEHLHILEKLGRTPDVAMDITPQDIIRAREIFTAGTPLENLSHKDKAIVKMVMQPIKPVYTGQVFDPEQDVMRTVYIKTSSFPLIPQFTKGLHIDKLREKMEELEDYHTPDGATKPDKHVRASYQSGNKVGAIKNAAQVFNDFTGEINDITMDDLLESSLYLDRINFRVQQDVPFKAGKKKEDTVKNGTQTTKLLFGNGVTDMDGFTLHGKTMDGRKLHKQFTQAWDKLLTHKKNKLYNDLGIDPKTQKPYDIKKSAKKLQKILREEAESRGYSKQVIDSLTMNLIYKEGTKEVIGAEFNLPLWMSAESNRFESLLNAVVTNKISQIKMPGNSYVVGSEAGFKQITQEEFEGEPSKIIYTDKWEGELKAAEYNEDGTLRKTQVMLPSRFRDANGDFVDLFAKDSSGQYIYIKEEKGTYKLKSKMIEKELLGNISFRIPTSAHLSMVDVEIVGILPYQTGDLMIVPKNLTTQIGLDFDVDKQTNYQYHHEVDEVTKQLKVLKGDIEETANLISQLEKELEEEQYEELESEVSDFKEQMKANLDALDKEIAQLKETKGNQDTLINKLFEQENNLYLEIQSLTEDINSLQDKDEVAKLKAERKELRRQHKKAIKDRQVLSTSKVKKEDLSDKKQERIKKKKEDRAAFYDAIKLKKQKVNHLKNTKKKEIADAKKKYEKLLHNEIVAIHSSVLSHPEMQEKINRVLSIAHSKNQAAMIEELIKESNMDEKGAKKRMFFTPASDEYQKAQMELGAGGKIGIGAYSTDVVLHSLVRQNEFPMYLTGADGDLDKVSNKSFTIGNFTSNGKLGNDKTLSMDDEVFYGRALYNMDTLESKELLDELNQTNDVPKVIKKIKKKYPSLVKMQQANQRDIATVLGERQNIATDNAKEQVMSKVNLNSRTLDVDKVLVLLGFDKDENGDSIPFLFMSQPIIRDFVKEMDNINSNVYGSKTNHDKNAEFIKDKQAYVVAKLKEKYGVSDAESLKNKNEEMTGGNLKQAIRNNGSDGDLQGAVLDMFLELQRYGKEIRKVQGTLNVDSQGLGKSTFDTIDRAEKIKGLFENESIQNAEKLIGDYKHISSLNDAEQQALIDDGYVQLGEFLIKPTTISGSFSVHTVAAAYNLWKDYFPYDSDIMTTIFTELTDAMNTSESGMVEAKQHIVREMRKYVNSSQMHLYNLDPQQERKRLFMDDEDGKSLASYLSDILNSPTIVETINGQEVNLTKLVANHVKNNRLIQKFEFDINTNGDISMIKFNNAIGEAFDESQVYNSMLGLLNQEIPLPNFNGKPYNTRLLAQDLINYALLEGGVQEAVQFAKIIPVAYLIKTNYAQAIKQIDFVGDSTNMFGMSNDTLSLFSFQYAQHNPEKFPKISKEKALNKQFAGDSKELKNLEYFQVKAKEDEIPSPFVAMYDSSIPKGSKKFHLFWYDGTRYVKVPTKGTFGMAEYNAQSKKAEKSIISPDRKPVPLKRSNLATKQQPQVANNNTITQRNIKEVISNIAAKDYAGLSDMAKALLPYVDESVKLFIGPFEGQKGRGKYGEESHSIAINSKFVQGPNTTPEMVAETILHEYVHSITVKQLRKHINFKVDKDGKPTKQIDSIKDDAPKYIEDLVRLFNVARKHFEEDGTLDAMRLSMSVDAALTPKEKLAYGTYDIFEFLAMLSANKEFQKKMADTPFKQSKKSMLDKFKEIIFKVLEDAGIKFPSDTVASQAIDSMFRLLEDVRIEKKKDEFAIPNKDKQFMDKTREMMDKIHQKLGNTYPVVTISKTDIPGKHYIANDTPGQEVILNPLGEEVQDEILKNKALANHYATSKDPSKKRFTNIHGVTAYVLDGPNNTKRIIDLNTGKELTLDDITSQQRQDILAAVHFNLTGEKLIQPTPVVRDNDMGMSKEEKQKKIDEIYNEYNASEEDQQWLDSLIYPLKDSVDKEIVRDDNKIYTVKGIDLTNIDGYNFFAYRDKSGNYSIVEESTGMSMTGMIKTKKDNLIQELNKVLEENPTWKEIIAKTPKPIQERNKELAELSEKPQDNVSDMFGNIISSQDMLDPDVVEEVDNLINEFEQTCK